ncbi:MAG: hypothetical protein ACYTF7_02800 [Planctomycetota bacterium]|jgi:hypothetical protein
MPDTVADITEAPLEVNAETDLSQVEDLEAVVDQLVAEIDQTVGEIEMSRSDPEARSVDEGELLSGDAVLTDAGENESVPTGAAPAPVETTDGASEGLPERVDEADASPEARVDQMMEDVSGVIEEFDASAAASEGEAASDAPEIGADELTDEVLGVCEESIEALDQKLSEDADSELEGDFETLDGDFESFDVSGQTSPAPSPGVVSAPAPEASSVAPVAPEAPSEPEETVAPSVPAGGASVVPRRSLLAHPAVARLFGVGRRVAEPAGDVMSLPLRRLSPSVRDTIGWVAINTLFIAACVWLFLLLR